MAKYNIVRSSWGVVGERYASSALTNETMMKHFALGHRLFHRIALAQITLPQTVGGGDDL